MSADSSMEIGNRLRELDRAIELRRKSARAIMDGRCFGGSVGMLREALALGVSASVDPARLLEPEAAAELLAELEPGATSAITVLRANLPDPSHATADTIAELDSVLSRLRRRYRTRSSEEIRFARRVRMALAIGGVLALLVTLLVSLLSAENVALGKPVVLSSHRDGTPQPATIVDGKRRAHAAASSNVEGSAWARIDLRGQFAIDRIVVYNAREQARADLLPLVLEISRDGVDYQEVGVRDSTFTDRAPWRIKLSGDEARYVRLRTARQLAAIALSEVEVYGRRLD